MSKITPSQRIIAELRQDIADLILFDKGDYRHFRVYMKHKDSIGIKDDYFYGGVRGETGGYSMSTGSSGGTKTQKKTRCCGRCDGINDECFIDMTCEKHDRKGCEICYGPIIEP